MPRYVYRCKKCEHIFEVTHSMSEKLKDCPACEVLDSLFRVPSNTIKKVSKKKKVGEIVKQHIKDAKEELKKDKKKMKIEEYKP